MINIKYDKTELPSQSIGLLSSLKGLHVINVYRLFDWDISNYMNTFGVKESGLFSSGNGPILLHMENDIIVSIISVNKYISVVLQKENSLEETIGKEGKYSECKVISNESEKYTNGEWKTITGMVIKSLNIIKIKNIDSSGRPFPNERGIEIIFEEGKRMFIAYKLCENIESNLSISSECIFFDDIKNHTDIISV